MRESWRSIAVRLENSGNKIISIRECKNKVVIRFKERDKLDIPLEIFTSHYLYKGKILLDKEIDEILEEVRVHDLYKYARNLLLARSYSEYKIREKLYLKEASKEDVDIIIDKLMKAKLINDEEYAKEYVEYAKNQRHGKNKIILKLKDKGIFSNNISSLKFDDEDEYDRAKSWLKDLERRYERYPYKAKKDHIIRFLISQGYDMDIAIKVSNLVKPSEDKKEIEKLKKDYLKLYEQYKRRYEGYELSDHLYNALRRKGYRSGDIKKIMEENEI